MKKQKGLKPFIELIQETNIPKLPLIFGLLGSILTTLAGLVIPLLTKNLVDNFSLDSLSVPLIIAIVVAFIIQGAISGLSLYLLTAVGQKIVARLRERM